MATSGTGWYALGRALSGFGDTIGGMQSAREREEEERRRDEEDRRRRIREDFALQAAMDTNRIANKADIYADLDRIGAGNTVDPETAARGEKYGVTIPKYLGASRLPLSAAPPMGPDNPDAPNPQAGVALPFGPRSTTGTPGVAEFTAPDVRTSRERRSDDLLASQLAHTQFLESIAQEQLGLSREQLQELIRNNTMDNAATWGNINLMNRRLNVYETREQEQRQAAAINNAFNQEARLMAARMAREGRDLNTILQQLTQSPGAPYAPTSIEGELLNRVINRLKMVGIEETDVKRLLRGYYMGDFSYTMPGVVSGGGVVPPVPGGGGAGLTGATGEAVQRQYERGILSKDEYITKMQALGLPPVLLPTDRQ